jgi:hypothetical protein
MALGLVIAIAGAGFLLAEEKVERVVAPEADELRPPQGEWIQSVDGRQATVWAVGDANPPNSNRVVRRIRRDDPDRVLYLGDVYPEGTRADFERWAEPWRGLLQRMAPTPGNHEWAGAHEGYEPFWREVTGEVPPTYYKFQAGGWDILAVNGEHSESGAVADWLTEEANSGGNCRIAFWHRPAYSAGKYKGGDARAREFWEALEGSARIVVSGHDHNMQRLRRRNGIVQFIAGAGGRHRHKVDRGARRLAFGDDDHFGALRLRLSSARVKWRFVAAGGRLLDRGSLGCRP